MLAHEQSVVQQWAVAGIAEAAAPGGILAAYSPYIREQMLWSAACMKGLVLQERQ